MPRKTSTAKKSVPVKSVPAPKPQPSSKPILSIDMVTVENLVALLERSQLTELELDTGEARLYISKNGPSMSAPAYAMPPAVAATASAAPAASKAEAPVSNRKLAEVTSPMVGTFYASPSPDSDPYVRDGQVVKEGQT